MELQQFWVLEDGKDMAHDESSDGGRSDLFPCRLCGKTMAFHAMGLETHGGADSRQDLRLYVDADPSAFLFKKRAYSPVNAMVCGNCGVVEFFATSHRELYEAFLQSPET